MDVKRNRIEGTITLSQEAYIRQALIARNIDIDKIKTVENPCDYSLHSSIDESELLDTTQHKIFQQDIGTLSYAAQMTRFDITFAVGVLSRKLAAPTKADARAVQRIFKYLAGTAHYALIFRTPKKLTGIVTYTDASYGNDIPTRKGITGVLNSVDGNTICVISRRQNCVALSSTESEYYAMGTGTCDAIWIQLWRYEVFLKREMITLRVDNQSAMQLAAHDGIHQRSKHIDIRYHFVRDHIKQNNIKVEWIPTQHQLADILTKFMANKQFTELVSKILLV